MTTRDFPLPNAVRRSGTGVCFLLLALVVPWSDARAQGTTPMCGVQGTPEQLATRPSPLDSTSVRLGDGVLKVCYSRPSMRGRVIYGGLVPWGRSWRTGANEPTTVHLTTAAEIAGVRLAPGRYVMMTVPEAERWTVQLNTPGRVSQGPGAFDGLAEIGRGQVKPERMADSVETFVIRAVPVETGAELVIEWERTRVRVPVRAVRPGAARPEAARPPR